MNTFDNLFKEFPEITREQWLARMEKDLRGQPLSDLEWHLEQNIRLAPLYHPDDLREAPAPITGGRFANQWEIGEWIEVTDVPSTNTVLREGLEGGVEAPLLILRRELSDAELDALLDGVHLEYISTHFTHVYPDKDPPALLRQFRRLAEARRLDPATLRGSIDYDPILDWARPPYDQLAETLRGCEADMPRFRMLQINGLRFHSGVENTSQELAILLAKASEYLAQLQQRDVAPDLVARQAQLTVAISTSYFVDIAKLRALNILWGNLLAAYGASPARPFIIGHLARETQSEDLYTNMIKAGMQAMAAVIGGVDRLYIRPANFVLHEPGTPFLRRIARNVQHILRLESFLDRVIDPAAGSYYIEQLTDKLAEEAWEQFREMERKGEFA